jgi:hypothetical protein
MHDSVCFMAFCANLLHRREIRAIFLDWKRHWLVLGGGAADADQNA